MKVKVTLVATTVTPDGKELQVTGYSDADKDDLAMQTADTFVKILNQALGDDYTDGWKIDVTCEDAEVEE